MPLPAGARIGPYEVTGALGAGGMGEVYRARDTRLDRDVAIKVLPELFSADADRVARFEREARMLASINHPNIAAIYGVERPEKTSGVFSHVFSALVMELVEGRDLSAIIAHGPMALDDALPIARQMIDALEAAHELGIVHRDLKPANIKVRADGTVKILDFGLAKAMDTGPASGVDASNSPTLTARATQMGMIIGTAAYMAPEQARGRAVDRRADIWAFGVVLYEMLAGRRAFDGEDISITLAGVLKEEVPWASLPPDLPSPIRRLLKRCLEKDPRKRLSAIGDARFELDESESVSSVVTDPAAVPARSRRRWRTTIGVLAALWLATLVPAALYFAPRSASLPVRFEVVTPESPVLGVALAMALSPDGRLLAFLAPSAPNKSPMVWVRPLDALEARPIAGTEGSSGFFWSHNSQWIAFYGAGVLSRIEVAGGPAQVICNVASFGGGTWNADGVILFASGVTSRTGSSLVRVPESGGTPTPVLSANDVEPNTIVIHPSFLPDGRHFLFTSLSTDAGKRGIYGGSLEGGAATFLAHASSNAAYAPSGALLYHRDGTLMAHPFDAASMRVTGSPSAIAADLLYTQVTGRAAFSVSRTGTLAYRTGGVSDVRSELTWFDRSGVARGRIGESAPYNQLRLSPDDRRVVLSRRDAKIFSFNLWMLDLGTNITSQLTFDAMGNSDPVWSPDSNAVMFESVKSGKRDFYTQAVGSREATLAFASPDDTKWLDDWSRDGKYALFHVPGQPSKLYSVALAGDATTRQAKLLAESRGNFDGAHFSPDGQWIAYMSSESDVYEVFVAGFPTFDRRQQVSSKGGGQPMWRGDSQELFYLSHTGELMSVKREGTGFGAPTRLFQSVLTRPNATIDQYAVSHDGQRFLFLQPEPGSNAGIRPITVVLNGPTSAAK